PDATVVTHDRPGPQRQVVPSGGVGPYRLAVVGPLDEVARARMPDRRPGVPSPGVDQGARGPQEVQVIQVAVVGDPTVPDPVVRKPQHEVSMPRSREPHTMDSLAEALDACS